MKSWVGSVFSMELRQVFAYRTDFWLNYVGGVVANLGIAYFLWHSIYQSRGVEQIVGYTFSGMMFYYLLAPLFERITRGYDNFQFSTEIYTGGLTSFLMYPVPYFSFKLVGQLARFSLSVLQLAGALALFVAWLGWPSEVHVTLGSALRALAICLAAGLVHFYISAIIEMVAFWADNVWSLVVGFRFLSWLLSGLMLPLEIFPPWAQKILPFTFFPYFIHAPIQTLLGRDTWQVWAQGMAVLTLWAVVLYAMTQSVWRRGLKVYSGVGQ